MRRDDFQFLAELLKRACGVVLTPERAKGRLERVAERAGFANVAALVAALRAGDEQYAPTVIEALTIRDTAFFRDRATFDMVRDTVLRNLRAARRVQRRLSIWSAACGTGQEPYSLAMLFASMPEFAGWNVDILATDASVDAIGQARAGLYSQAEIECGLPGRMLGYFRREGSSWRLSPAVQAYVRFEVLNLLESFAERGPFDIILCRNVLMYFDTTTKTDVLNRLWQVLADDGYLLLGAAETLLGTSGCFVARGNAGGLTVKANAPVSASAIPGTAQ
jgi:chemotaxis protein methyltransferase CheR